MIVDDIFSFLRIYTAAYAFFLLYSIISEADLYKGMVTAVLFVTCMWCSIMQNEPPKMYDELRGKYI